MVFIVNGVYCRLLLFYSLSKAAPALLFDPDFCHIFLDIYLLFLTCQKRLAVVEEVMEYCQTHQALLNAEGRRDGKS